MICPAGPPRQATGPPRSDAGVVVGMLRDAGLTPEGGLMCFSDTRKGPYSSVKKAHKNSF